MTTGPSRAASAILPGRSRGWLRPLIGAALSAAFLALTLSRVNIGQAAETAGRVSLPLLGVALVAVLTEIGIRAYRWQCLLAPVVQVRLVSSYTYICIGHFANTLLPARLGDAARAYLAGGSFRASRMTILGTILVERLSDGALIFSVVAIAVVAGSPALWPLVIGAGVVVAFAGIVVVAILLAVTRTRAAQTKGGSLVRDLGVKLAEGGQALRSPANSARIAAATALSFAAAVVTFDLVARSAGVTLQPWQSAVVIGAATLSTAFPAGPGAIGTYEFVGVLVMTSMGVAAEQAFVTIALVHALVTGPPAALGLVAAWRGHWGIPSSADLRSSATV
jgi:glycosyltransferase 2 family protein